MRWCFCLLAVCWTPDRSTQHGHPRRPARVAFRARRPAVDPQADTRHRRPSPEGASGSGCVLSFTGLTPAQLTRILRRISNEGWIERLPGYGWEFQPMLTELRAYQDSYRLRLTIEPAAILEPTFTLDRAAIDQVRAQQQRLVDGDIWTIGNAELFDLNSGFHEAVMECSNNPFFIDALKRIDRLRRLIEYRRSLARTARSSAAANTSKSPTSCSTAAPKTPPKPCGATSPRSAPRRSSPAHDAST